MRQLLNLSFFILLIIGSPDTGYAQKTLLEVLKKNDLRELKAYIKEENKGKSCDAGECRANIRFDREIFKGYREVWGYYIDADREYDLVLIANDNAIIYWRLDTIYDRSSGVKDKFVNKKAYNNLLTDYRMFYGAPLNENELFAVPASFALEACGEGGYFPDMYLTMDSLISTKNLTVLGKWLRSVNIETQLYAIEAFSRLNLPLNSEDKKIIRYILSKDGTVQSCEGCDSSDRSVKDIVIRKGYLKLLEK